MIVAAEGCSPGKGAAEYLVRRSGQAAGLVNKREHGQLRVGSAALQKVQAVLVVHKLHIAPVNALLSILLLQTPAAFSCIGYPNSRWKVLSAEIRHALGMTEEDKEQYIPNTAKYRASITKSSSASFVHK